LLDLLLTKRFPRIWVPTPEERDLRQLLKHRDRLVRMQTSARNQLHFLAMSQGLSRKRKLWSAKGRAELEALSLGPWAAQRRQELVELLDSLGLRLKELN
jgi:transposase